MIPFNDGDQLPSGVENVRVVSKDGKAQARADVLLDEPCPRCGEKLAIKQGRYGEFTACSSYPKCRYVKMKETGVNCPECSEGQIVERRSKRGKVFFGCDRYPDCEFVLWKRPVDKPCPGCDRTYMQERITKKSGRELICDAENCGHSEEAEVEEKAEGEEKAGVEEEAEQEAEEEADAGSEDDGDEDEDDAEGDSGAES